MSKSCKLGLLETDSIEFKKYPEFMLKTVGEIIKELIKNKSNKKVSVGAICKMNGVYFSVPFIDTYVCFLEDDTHADEVKALSNSVVYGVSENCNTVSITTTITDRIEWR